MTKRTGPQRNPAMLPTDRDLSALISSSYPNFCYTYRQMPLSFRILDYEDIYIYIVLRLGRVERERESLLYEEVRLQKKREENI